MKRKIYPWLICLMSTILISCCMGLTNGTFSVFQPYLVESGLTNTQASSILTVRNVFGCIGIALITQYYDRMKMRRGMVVNLLIGMTAFVIYSHAKTYPMFLAAAALSGICYGWGGILPASILIRRWFKKDCTLALGISGSGTGVAMMILPTILTTVIEQKGMYAAFRMNAVIMAVTAGMIFLTIRESPKEAGLICWGEEESEKQGKQKSIQGHGLTVAEKLMMFFSMMLLGICTQPEINHLAVYFHELNFDSMLAPKVISSIGLTLIVGKCIYGFLVDRFESFYINLIYYVTIVVGLIFLALCTTGNIGFAYAAGILLGFGTTLATVGMMTIAGDLETPEKYMKTGKYFQLTYLGAVLVFSSVPGMAADLTGSYIPVYMVVPGLMAVGMILAAVVYIRHRKTFYHK